MKVLSNTLVATQAASFYFCPKQLFMSILKNNQPKHRGRYPEKNIRDGFGFRYDIRMIPVHFSENKSHEDIE